MIKSFGNFWKEAGKETLIDLLPTIISKIYSHSKEKSELKDNLAKLRKPFKERYDYLTPSEKIDIDSLHNYLIKNLDVFKNCFIAASHEEWVSNIDSLKKILYREAGAKTNKQKEFADEYINTCLRIFSDSLRSKITPEILCLVAQQTEDMKKFIDQQTETIEEFSAKLITYILNVTEKLETLTKHQGDFEKYIDAIELESIIEDFTQVPWERGEHDNLWFHYLNPEIGFVRRDAQFEFLDNFLEDEAELLSLAITGYGGIGKNKLMHQYILELRSKSVWSAAMLDRSAVDRLCHNFTSWYYPKNLLLVIDYAAGKSEIIGEWIREVYQSKNRPPKMRIILLERQGITKVNEQIIQPLWYEQMYKASGKLLGLIEYKHGNGFMNCHGSVKKKCCR